MQQGCQRRELWQNKAGLSGKKVEPGSTLNQAFAATQCNVIKEGATVANHTNVKSCLGVLWTAVQCLVFFHCLTGILNKTPSSTQPPALRQCCFHSEFLLTHESRMRYTPVHHPKLLLFPVTPVSAGIYNGLLVEDVKPFVHVAFLQFIYAYYIIIMLTWPGGTNICNACINYSFNR